MRPPYRKVCDLHSQIRRGRPPVLIGRCGDLKLVIYARHEPLLGEPTHTLFVTGWTAPERRTPKEERDRSR